MIYLAFFLSGASALLFETLWFRLAGLTFGNSVWASSLVLASFMAGLALGNGLAMRWGPGTARPIRLYALLELAIGASGLGLVLLFPILTPALVPVFRPLLDTPWLLNSLRLGIAFSLMVIPAAAMGATLPLLVKALCAADENFGRVLGRLYGWNTLGAVVGAVSGELLLISLLGLRGTGLFAALLNALAAMVAVYLSRRHEATSQGAAPPQERIAAIDFGRWRLLLAAFLCGATLLALEVVWFRFLQLFVLGTSLTFALMLAVVLLGIAGGGFAASTWLGRDPTAHRFLPHLAVGTSGLTVLTFIAFAPSAGQPWAVGSVLSAAIRLMLPVSLLSGCLFTFLGRALKDEVPDETEAAGGLTLANTLGGMVGALLGGLAILPHLGVERSIFSLSLVYAVVALCAGSSPLPLPRERWNRQALWAASASLAVFLALFPFGLMKNHFIRRTTGTFTADGSELVGVREGVTETVLYFRKDEWGEPLYHRLVTNNFSMSASQTIGRRYMKLYVYWPIALNPDTRSALLISYGVGSTAKALTDTASLASIDVVDISRTILEMNALVFPDPASHPLRDPRVRVHIEDGRFFLQTTERRFDLITGEPPPPKHAGIVNLYSREYFALVHERLTPGGIVTYWLPVFNLTPEDSKAITRAFCSVFEDCSLWNGAALNWMLIGTRNAPGSRDEASFSRQWGDAVVSPELRALGFEEPEQLGATFIGDAPFLERWTQGHAPLVDDRPYRISSRVPSRPAPEYLSVMDARKTRERFARSKFVRRVWPDALLARTLDAFESQAVFNALLSRTETASAPRSLRWALTRPSGEFLPLLLMNSDPDLQRLAAAAAARGIDDRRLDYQLAVAALAGRDYERAADLLGELHAKQPDAAWIVFLRVLALQLGGNVEGARSFAQAAQARAGDLEDETWALVGEFLESEVVAGR